MGYWVYHRREDVAVVVVERRGRRGTGKFCGLHSWVPRCLLIGLEFGRRTSWW